MQTKPLTIVKGKGTKAEQRITTRVTLYWCEKLQRWISIPE